MLRSEEFLLPGIETMKLFQGTIYSQVPASCHFWGRWTIWEDLMSSEIIQEDRIHSGPQVSNEWDSCESEEDKRGPDQQLSKIRWACAAMQGALKALSSWNWRPQLLQRGWVGAVRTKGCSSPGAGRYNSRRLLCQHSEDQHSLEPLCYSSTPVPPSKCLINSDKCFILPPFTCQSVLV